MQLKTHFFADASMLKIEASGRKIPNVAWVEWGDGWIKLGVNIEVARHETDVVPFLVGAYGTNDTEIKLTYGSEERIFNRLTCKHRAVSAFVNQCMQEEFWLAPPAVTIPSIETEVRLQNRLVWALKSAFRLETTLHDKGE